MGTAERLLTNWSLVQSGSMQVEHTQNGSGLWSVRVEANIIQLKIQDFDALISLMDEIITASAPLRAHVLKIMDAYGYEPEGMVFSKLNLSSLSKIAWIGDVLAAQDKRLELYNGQNLLLVLGSGAKPGLLGLAGMKHVEAPRKAELLGMFRKIHPLMKKLK
ncbi:MAG: hypothetical protein QCI38_01615 [Candidatus Thermoplasmatota archaeon]|nr:hypothetical protein [Candidatus Thermoplasmatota archaeon]